MKSTLLVALLLRCALASQWTVGVGKDELTGQKGVGFDPSAIHPVQGDDIVFEFRSGSHSVVQSTFENPCVPLDGGYNSGVFTVDDSKSVDASDLPTTSLKVNSTDPMWFFDQAGGQCQKGGVLSVNPSFSQPAATFVSNAENSPSTATAGGSSSATGGGSSSTATTTAPGGSSSAASSTTASSGGAAAPSNSNSASQYKSNVGLANVAGLGGAALAFFVGF